MRIYGDPPVHHGDIQRQRDGKKLAIRLRSGTSTEWDFDIEGEDDDKPSYPKPIPGALRRQKSVQADQADWIKRRKEWKQQRKRSMRFVVVQCDRCLAKASGTVLSYLDRRPLRSVNLPASLVNDEWVHNSCGGVVRPYDIEGAAQ